MHCCCSVIHKTFETFDFCVLRLAANNIKSDKCSRIYEFWEWFTQRQNDKSCLIANITLRRGGIWNLAQTPRKKLKTHWKKLKLTRRAYTSQKQTQEWQMSILAKSLQRIKESLHLTKVQSQATNWGKNQTTFPNIARLPCCLVPIVLYRESKPASIPFFCTLFLYREVVKTVFLWPGWR